MNEIASGAIRIPEWVANVLASYETRTDPHNEVQIADLLDSNRRTQGDLDDEAWRGYLAERSAFLFADRSEEDSVWETYFAPMFTATQNDGTELRVPDVKDFDLATVTYWEGRARSVQNPIMRARYADLVWDLDRVITRRRRGYEYAQIAIDSYLEAANLRLYPMAIEGVGWLGRALNLSISISDRARQRRTVEAIFDFYDKTLNPTEIGVWTFPFDCLYGTRDLLTQEEEARLVTNLETMLSRTSGQGDPAEFDPFGAQAAAERLVRHYKRQNDKSNAHRAIKAYGQAFEKLSKDASPMLATAWLQPVIERYEQEGLSEEAEQLQTMSAEKRRNIGAELKTVEVKTEIKQADVDALVEHLLGSGDLGASLGRVAEYFIPNADRARDFLEKMKTETPFLSMVSTVVVAGDGRPSARIGSLEEDADGRLHGQLAQNIGFYAPFLAHTLDQLRVRYAPSVETFSTVFINHHCLSKADGNFYEKACSPINKGIL